MTSDIAKKRYKHNHKQTDFLKYCSPSAAALGEEKQSTHSLQVGQGHHTHHCAGG